jgi:hypothetical protein
MKVTWFYQNDFEDLMNALTSWMEKAGTITVVNVDYRNANDGWYCILFYK